MFVCTYLCCDEIVIIVILCYVNTTLVIEKEIQRLVNVLQVVAVAAIPPAVEVEEVVVVA